MLQSHAVESQNAIVSMPNPRIEAFKKVLAVDPRDDTAWFGLGKAFMSDENWPEAISALEECIHVQPSYSAAFYALAQSLQSNDEIDRCRETCQQGIDVATANGDLMVIKNLEVLQASLT
ncbi:MAG: hypothetical protein GKS05_00900 [Nitrospirales bacterium]|nr:hypothetical protein [Nitrospirales bacterium]